MVALLADGADVNEATTYANFKGVTALRIACEEGHTRSSRSCLPTADVDQADDSGTALCMACQFAHTEIIAELLAANSSRDEGQS